MTRTNLQRLAKFVQVKHPGITIELPVQKDAAYLWQAAAIHPMQSLQNVHQRIVRSAMRKAADDAARMSDGSAALSNFFHFNATVPTILPKPKQAAPVSAGFIEEALEALALEQGQLGKLLRRAASYWEDLGDGSGFLNGVQKQQLADLANRRIGDLNRVLAVAPRADSVAALIVQLDTELKEFNGAIAAAEQPAVGEVGADAPAVDAQQYPVLPTITAQLAAASVAECRKLGTLAQCMLDAIEKLVEHVNGMSCIANLYVIDTFYLWRLMIRFRCTSAAPIDADCKNAISGDLTSFLHNSDDGHMRWLTTWLTGRLADLHLALQKIDKKGDLIFYLKGGRALYYCIERPEMGTNDFDTSIVINPNLPVDQWYRLFNEVHNCCLERLRQYKHELLQLMADNQDAFTAHLDALERERALARENAVVGVVALEQPPPPAAAAAEEFLALLQGLVPASKPESAKAELIDIGIPRRDTTEVWEVWHLKPDIVESDGVPRPGALYYVNEYVMMIREALVPGSRSGRKSAKRLSRLGDLLQAEAVKTALKKKKEKFSPSMLMEVNGTLRAFGDFQNVAELLFEQLAHAYLLQEDCGYQAELIREFNAECAALRDAPLPDDIADAVSKLQPAATAIANNVNCFQLFSSRMEQHIKDRGAFFSSTRIRAELGRFVKAIYTASIFNKPEDELEIMFAITGSFAATLHAEYANHERMLEIEPLHRVDLTVFCRENVNPDVVMEVTVPAIVAAYASHPETPAYVPVAQAGNIVDIFWPEEVTFAHQSANPLENISLTYRPLAIRVTVVARPDLPQLSFIWGYPVLGLRDLVWDYIRQAGLTEEFGVRKRLSATAEALTDILTRHENPGPPDAPGQGAGASGAASAPADGPGGEPPGHVAPVSHEITGLDDWLVAQEQPEWCYAAVTVMMRRRHRPQAVAPTQQRIVMEMYPAATPENVVVGYGNKRAYAPLGGFRSTSTALAWDEIKRLIDGDKPIVFGMRDHYTLIIGYRDDQYLLLWDPLPVGVGHRRWHAYAHYRREFTQGGTNIYDPL